MREKDIKRQVLKQLNKEFRNWRQLPRKQKKQIAKHHQRLQNHFLHLHYALLPKAQ